MANSKKLIKKANKKYLQALDIEKDFNYAFFNLACSEALQNNEAECKQWLEKLVKIKPLTKQRINDSDLDFVRDKTWLKKWTKAKLTNKPKK